MKGSQVQLDELCINTIRFLSVDAVEKAKSGHPGTPMGLAPAAYVLWTRFLRHNPKNPAWPGRDRFVLSAGHASMLLYSLLHLTGYGVSLEDIKQFRQWGSPTAGHPEYGHAPGVETTTGPLGQGFANGVGMAAAARYLGAYFNRPGHTILDPWIYAITSDGDLMEGIASEAASLAGHLKLGNLIYLYDDNRITIDGSTTLSFSGEDVRKRFEAYGWQVLQESTGTDIEAMAQLIGAAQGEREKPSLIILRTHIGYGSPNKQDTAEAHGAPLGEEEVKLAKQNLGWPLEPAFYIPDDALQHFKRTAAEGEKAEKEWNARFAKYAAAYPDLAAEWNRFMRGELAAGWDEKLPVFQPSDGKVATRSASGKVLNAAAGKIPNLIGGSADLATSNNTLLKGGGDFSSGNPKGRNIYFGVREHAMGGMVNGMAAFGGVIPYGATFLIFSDYMRPSIRLSALMNLPSVFIFTHDSIGLGEDGPTHQPVEHLMSLRAIPNLTVIRPADANETREAWRFILTCRKGPAALILTRQGLPVLDRASLAPAEELKYGAYILSDTEGQPDILLLASGSEVPLILQAKEKLAEKKIQARVVSVPSFELFDKQPEAYRRKLLPPEIKKRLSVEAGIRRGWESYVGPEGGSISLERFGASAPGDVLMKQFGFTVENVVERALALVRAS